MKPNNPRLPLRNRHKFKSAISTITRLLPIVFVSLSIPALTCSCATTPAEHLVIQRQLVAPPAEVLAARTCAPWTGGDYGDLGAWAKAQRTCYLLDEGDKASVRDFVSRERANAAVAK